MQHEGPLKLSTGLAFMDVEPFPRMKLMKLYHLTLQEIQDLPDNYGYKFLSQELTRFRMKVVDETKSIRAIEEKIAHGIVEELIVQAHNELKLIRLMKRWKPWEGVLNEVEDEHEDILNLLHIRYDNPFPTDFENFEATRHEKKDRKEGTKQHPEEK
eukprot:CAMPEP_0202965028 /NCGR_PEP_ID=MMETSP1396-20130829/9144_1 /ASSEMBLY_ACC=CAM_ASM_000872 /TAXON_ID= /ORGANISM="Pseudokeronopsis sp., Strain Brazil" /LENGTH=156 /DNA_ID=CAMNT_0049687615 /DNA_START=175 /DNA_END=645 /DNA_ORIENTATION=-